MIDSATRTLLTGIRETTPGTVILYSIAFILSALCLVIGPLDLPKRCHGNVLFEPGGSAFHDSSLVFIAALVTMMWYDLSLILSQKWESARALFTGTFLSRWLLIAVSIITELLVLTAESQVVAQIYWTSYSAREMISMSIVMLSKMQTTDQPVVGESNRKITMAVSCFGVSRLLRLVSGGMYGTGSIAGIISITLDLLLLGSFLLYKIYVNFIPSTTAASHKARHSGSGSDHSNEGKNSGALLISRRINVVLALTGIGYFILFAVFGTMPVGSIRTCEIMENDSFLAAYTYLMAFAVISIVIVLSQSDRTMLLRSNEVSDMKRVIVRYISHELRTPLNAISTGLQLTQSIHSSWRVHEEEAAAVAVAAAAAARHSSSYFSTEFEEMMEGLSAMADDMKESSDSAVNLLNDLLIFDKLEYGEMAVVKGVERVNDVLQEACRPFVGVATHSGIKFVWKSADPSLSKPLFVEVDRIKIVHALRSLISNAFNYTKAGGSITVRAVVKRDPVRRKTLLTDQLASLRFVHPTPSADEFTDSPAGGGDRFKFKKKAPPVMNAGAMINGGHHHQGGGGGYCGHHAGWRSRRGYLVSLPRKCLRKMMMILGGGRSSRYGQHQERGIASSNGGGGGGDDSSNAATPNSEVNDDGTKGPREFVRIEVRDTGPGLSREKQHALFKQAMKFTLDELYGGQGTGLGLYINRGILQLHGGRIGVFSAGEGRGATFYMDIPVYDVPIPAAGDGSDKEHTAATAGAGGAGGPTAVDVDADADADANELAHRRKAAGSLSSSEFMSAAASRLLTKASAVVNRISEQVSISMNGEDDGDMRTGDRSEHQKSKRGGGSEDEYRDRDRGYRSRSNSENENENLHSSSSSVWSPMKRERHSSSSVQYPGYPPPTYPSAAVAVAVSQKSSSKSSGGSNANRNKNKVFVVDEEAAAAAEDSIDHHQSDGAGASASCEGNGNDPPFMGPSHVTGGGGTATSGGGNERPGMQSSSSYNAGSPLRKLSAGQQRQVAGLLWSTSNSVARIVNHSGHSNSHSHSVSSALYSTRSAAGHMSRSSLNTTTLEDPAVAVAGLGVGSVSAAWNQNNHDHDDDGDHSHAYLESGGGAMLLDTETEAPPTSYVHVMKSSSSSSSFDISKWSSRSLPDPHMSPVRHRATVSEEEQESGGQLSPPRLSSSFLHLQRGNSDNSNSSSSNSSVAASASIRFEDSSRHHHHPGNGNGNGNGNGGGSRSSPHRVSDTAPLALLPPLFTPSLPAFAEESPGGNNSGRVVAGVGVGAAGLASLKTECEPHPQPSPLLQQQQQLQLQASSSTQQQSLSSLLQQQQTSSSSSSSIQLQQQQQTSSLSIKQTSSSSSLSSTQQQQQQQQQQQKSSSSPSVGKIRALVVDDSGANRKMLCRLLKLSKLCDAPDEAEDGVLAVEFMNNALRAVGDDENLIPDVILMDFVMPNMCGPDATRIIREAGYTGRIIGVTGNALPEDIELFLSQGADAVMLKPVNTKELVALLLMKP